MKNKKNSQIINFGCRLNAYESEVIKNINSIENAIIFNTCAVTKEAEKQARQAIRKTKRENPNKKILITGCAAQTNAKSFLEMQEVDLVFGNEFKTNKHFYKKLEDVLSKREERLVTSDIMEKVEEKIDYNIASFEDKTRAFVQIQNGCDHRCTFCIIPYGRGNSRSVPSEEIIKQVKLLSKNGYKEIILTGVDLTSYGQDLETGIKLGTLCKRILNEVPELPRLRLSSVDVAEIDDDLLYILEHNKRFMPHLHISLQSGNNLILKRMKRRHTREDVIEFCQKVRQIRPDIAFGSDIIAGFPTENEVMFEETSQLLRECNIVFNHIFSFSPRENTPAEKMPQVDIAIKKERTKRLIKESDALLEKFLLPFINQTVDIIVEYNNYGRMENFAPVIIENEEAKHMQGQIKTVLIKSLSHNKKSLIAELI